MNQLVVPFGKKSKIELADGTRLWLNSGSRAIYPVVFQKGKREIYLEGEGYLEVAHNASSPFYVVTDQMKVRVLGTKFNLSAYKEDASVSVVLVEGSVEASSESGKLILKPNQLLNYQKSTRESTISHANVLQYVSWIDGWMLCDKEKLSSIFTTFPNPSSFGGLFESLIRSGSAILIPFTHRSVVFVCNIGIL